MELIDELKLALFNLVKLKDHKDEKGKDEFYAEYQPKMWLFAKQVLNKCGDEPLFEDSATLPMQNVRVTLLLEFAEWIGTSLWAKVESKSDTYIEVDGWYNTHNYKAMKSPLTTQGLWDLFIVERGHKN